MGGFILAPSLLARVFGYGESRTGLLIISRPLSFSLMAPVAGYLAVRVGGRTAATVGCSVVVGSMVALAALDGASSDLAIVGALSLSGIGLGMASPSLAASVANAVADERLGSASAAQQLMGQVGAVAGIQVMKTVQAAREGAVGLVPSFGDAYYVGGAVCLLAVLCGAFVLSSPGAEPDADGEADREGDALDADAAGRGPCA
jgi:MFS family permease